MYNFTTFAHCRRIFLNFENRSGCPAHVVDNTLNSHSALYQQYTLEVPILNVQLPPSNDPIPSFGGPVGIAIDGSFLYGASTTSDADAVMTETFDRCFGASDELVSYSKSERLFRKM